MKSIVTIITFVFLVIQPSYSQNVIVKPKEINDILINPGMGFTTFGRFNSDHVGGGENWTPEQIDELLQDDGDLQYCGYPPSSVAYFRWYWDVIEPEEGQYNWELIDETIEKAKQNGQKLAFRIMPQNGEPKAPAWYREIAPGFSYENGQSWMPDYEHPLFMKHYGNLVKALAKRYDGHPQIDHIDIGILGRWGEWHTSQTGHPMPSAETQKKFVDLYLDHFKESLLVMLIGGREALAYAIENGAGWRADCLGDVGGFSSNWNHMEDMYPIALAQANAHDAWKKAPAVFETCWTIQHWIDEGWNVKEILDRALTYHTIIVNNKSSKIPKEYWKMTNDFLRRMGYRYVLRRLQFAENVKPGSTIQLQTLWENIGVSPIYHSYKLVYQIKNDEAAYEHTSEVDIRDWLPGYHLTHEQIPVPENAKPGTYFLRVALLDPNTEKATIRLAIEGREPDGWYHLCQFRIR